MGTRIAAVCAVASALAVCSVAAVAPHPDWENSLKPAGAPGPELLLADGGETSWAIALPAEPTGPEQKAAEELARWLKEMTGVEFPVLSESVTHEGGLISLGRTQAFAEDRAAGSDADLADEGYGIAVSADRLFLFGGRTRGVVNAVFALLEEDLGCRWYAKGQATIPSRPTLRFRPVPRVYVPPLGIRDPFCYDAFSAEWSIRNRTNADRAGVPDEWGGTINFAPGYFVHTFERLVPSKVYFEEHPEYFCEIEGERRPHVAMSFGGQLCLTNPDVAKIATEKVREVLREHPNAELISVSQNDGRGGHCQCAECMAIDEPEGTRAGTLIKFVNAVAGAIADEFPDVKVCTLAYQATFMPPKTIRPRENVVVRLCTDAHAWGSPFLFVTETEKFQTALKGWAEIGANIIIWDYVTSFGAYLKPWPNMPVVADNIRFYLEHNARGIMLQGAYQSPGAHRAPMRSWVWARQLWDPSLDTQTLMRDFTYGYFGAAAEPMQAYNHLLRQTWQRHHDGPEEGKGYPIDRAFIAKGRALFAQAEGLAAEDEELLGRVTLAKLSVLYGHLDMGPENAEQVPAYLQVVNGFEAIAAANKVTHLRERPRGVEQHIQRWRAMAGKLSVKVDVPGTILCEDMDMRLATHLGQHSPRIVPDELADNGFAVRQPGGSTHWSIQWVPPVDDLKPDVEYLVRARVRVEKTGDEGPACHAGVYNPPTKEYGTPTKRVSAAEAATDEYRWVDIGTIVPKEGDYIYIAPDKNIENVQGILTDRIELVPQE